MDYDLLIVGAGFAGCELAYAVAQKGTRVGLLTTSLDSVFLPFGPVKGPFPEGSLLGQVGEGSGWELHSRAKYKLESLANLHLVQHSVTKLVVESDAVRGVHTWEGPSKSAANTVLAVGSFLDAKLYIGDTAEEAGRLSEAAYPDLYQSLLELGLTFSNAEAAVAPQSGSLGYRVEHKVINEWEPATFRLPLKNLYALGLCVLGGGSYNQMAEEALKMAKYF
jgi:tRNA U34 5-carboxymethylaminomethyl modifying enzyme MnmG/GidA